jgi:PTH1 family peptidyl-tRNA hydrolase
MKLIVGLGNPGSKYSETRHNVGFHAIAELIRRFATATARSKFHGELTEASIANQSCLLLCPHTYMNRSGQSVLAARDFYKIATEDLLVISDDFNLPLAKLRVRAKGSAGGQKGLEDIILRLGTDEIARLRIGIGPVEEGWNPADFVLARFRKDEITTINETISRSADAVQVWVRDGIQLCMNQFNAG